jgi:hypothetical protein
MSDPCGLLGEGLPGARRSSPWSGTIRKSMRRSGKDLVACEEHRQSLADFLDCGFLRRVEALYRS